MNWIIWTIGWFLAAMLEEVIYLYLSSKIKIEEDKFVGTYWRTVKTVVWVIGMFKFW